MPSGSKKRKSKKPPSPTPGGLPPPPAAAADEPAEEIVGRFNLDEDPQEEGDPLSPGRAEDGDGVEEGVAEESEEQVNGVAEDDEVDIEGSSQTPAPWETEKYEQAGALEANGDGVGHPPLLDDSISPAFTVSAQEEDKALEPVLAVSAPEEDKALDPAPVELEARADLDMGVSAAEVENPLIANESMELLEGDKAAPAVAQQQDEEEVVEQADPGDGNEEDNKDVEERDVPIGLVLEQEASNGVPSELTFAEDREADMNLQASLSKANLDEQSQASIAEPLTASEEAVQSDATEEAEEEAPQSVDTEGSEPPIGDILSPVPVEETEVEAAMDASSESGPRETTGPEGEAASKPPMEDTVTPFLVEGNEVEAAVDEGSESGLTETTGSEVTTEEAVPSVSPQGAEADRFSENVEAESFPSNFIAQTEDDGEAIAFASSEGTEAPIIEEAVPSAEVESRATSEEAVQSACLPEDEVTKESSALAEEVEVEAAIEGEATEESVQSALTGEDKVRAAVEECGQPALSDGEVATEGGEAAEESVEPAFAEEEVATEEVAAAEEFAEPALTGDELASEEGEDVEESVEPALAAEDEFEAAAEEGEAAEASEQAAYAEEEDKTKPANKEGEAADESLQPALAEDELATEEGEAAEESVEPALTGDEVATEEGKSAEESVQPALTEDEGAAGEGETAEESEEPALTEDEGAAEEGETVEESVQPALTEDEGATEEVTPPYAAEEGEFDKVCTEEAKDSNEVAIGEYVPSAAIEQHEPPSDNASEAATVEEEHMVSDGDTRDIGSLPGRNDSEGERAASDMLEQCDFLTADATNHNGVIQEETKEGDTRYFEGEGNFSLSVEGPEGVESFPADPQRVREQETPVMSETSLWPGEAIESIDTKNVSGNEVEVSPSSSYTEGLEGMGGSVPCIEQEQVGNSPRELKVVAVDEASSEPSNAFLDEEEVKEVFAAEAQMPLQLGSAANSAFVKSDGMLADKLEHGLPLEEQQDWEVASRYGDLDGSTEAFIQQTEHTPDINSSSIEKQIPHRNSPEGTVEFGEEQSCESSLEEPDVAKGNGRLEGVQSNGNTSEVLVVDDEKEVFGQLANELRGKEESTNGFAGSSEDPILESSAALRLDSDECKLLQDAAESLPVVEVSLSQKVRSTSLPLVARVPEKEVHVDQRSLRQKGISTVQGPITVARKNKWWGCCGMLDALFQRD